MVDDREFKTQSTFIDKSSGGHLRAWLRVSKLKSIGVRNKKG